MYTFLTICSSALMLFMAAIPLITEVTLFDKFVILTMAVCCMVVQVLCVTEQFERRVVSKEAISVKEILEREGKAGFVPTNSAERQNVPVEEILGRFEGYNKPRTRRSWYDPEELITV